MRKAELGFDPCSYQDNRKKKQPGVRRFRLKKFSACALFLNEEEQGYQSNGLPGSKFDHITVFR
jgi:hypothetical protein